MAISPKLLNEGEHIVVSTRTHPKALLKPILVLIAVAAASSWIGVIAPRDSWGTAIGVVVGVVAVVVLLWWVVRPLINWMTTSYTFTNRRFLSRSGFIAKEGRTIPLNRISGVDFEFGVIDRLFGCGTLIVSDASAEGQVALHDIPKVEDVQLKVAAELHRLSEGVDRRDDGA